MPVVRLLKTNSCSRDRCFNRTSAPWRHGASSQNTSAERCGRPVAGCRRRYGALLGRCDPRRYRGLVSLLNSPSRTSCEARKSNLSEPAPDACARSPGARGRRCPVRCGSWSASWKRGPTSWRVRAPRAMAAAPAVPRDGRATRTHPGRGLSALWSGVAGKPIRQKIRRRQKFLPLTRLLGKRRDRRSIAIALASRHGAGFTRNKHWSTPRNGRCR